MTTSSVDSIRDWLTELGAQLDWEPVITEEGYSVLRAANGASVLIEPHPHNERQILLHTEIGAVNFDTKAKLLLSCLGLNSVLMIDGRYTVGYSPAAEQITFSMLFAHQENNWDAQTFFMNCSQFLLLSDQLKSALANGELDSFGEIAISSNKPQSQMFI